MRNILGVIERKMLGALMILVDDNGIVDASNIEIANTMGYAKAGGALTLAAKVLESENYIIVLNREAPKREGRKYKILIP